MKFRQIVIAAQALCCLIISTQAGAASVTTANEDVLKRMAVDYQVQTLDGAAIGEQIGLQRGSLSFKATDLNIKGNGPDIVIARTYKGENHSYHKSVDMADWSFDIPHIYTTVVRTMGRNTSGPWGKNKACSETMEPETMYYIVSGKDQFIEPNGFHNGDFLFSHESGTENLYEDNSQKFGANVTRITKSNWKFECIQFRHNGQTMEGFVGYSPSGLKYTFNQPIRERIKSGSTFGAPVTDIGIPAPEDSNSALYFHAKYLYVSKIEDRFGRAIEYQYDGDRLQSIVATDGRQVNFEYDPSSMHLPLPNISAITYAGRRFVYTYEQPAGALYRSLTRVDIGENLYWQYQLHEMSEYYPEGSSGSGERTSCAKTPRFSGSGGTVGNLSIKHPAGFKVRYEVQCTHFGRAKVPPKVDTLEGKKYLTPYSYGEIAIQKKTLDYDNGKSYVWQYQYSGNQGFSTDQAVTASNQLQGIALPSGLSPELLNATTVTHPNGSKTTSVYDRSFTSATEGALLFEFTKDAAGATLSSTQKRYEHTRVIGWNGVFFENGQLATYDTALTQNITKVFHNNQSSQYRTVLSDFDMFGRSGKKAEYSADESRVKYTKNTYLNDLTYWLLGQPVTSAISANDSSYQQTEEYKYYPANSAEKSSLKEYWDYQRKIYSLEYQADGNVSRKTYNLANRWVSYQDYQLGLPKLVQFPDRYDGTKTSSIALNYDVFSNVTKTTDFNGNVTDFSYDDVGRLELIDPASSTIADTVITYTVLDSFRSQQEVRKGNYRAQGIYDGLRRAILTSEWDASDEASTRKQQFKEYDANNAVAFQSQFLSDANVQSPGTRFEFDGLGRLKKTVFANGHSETNDYLSGHEIKHTNAKLQPTTTTYLALGAPDYSNPLRIEQPENITTTFAYNTAGYVTEITQGGYSETRVYDDKMQLCLQKRPETGIKAMQYNDLGQPSKYAEGLSGGGSHCLDYTNVAASWVSTVYDNHGEQSQLNFADGSSPNKVFRFDAQGNLKTLSASGTIWDYTYNAAHQVETETLSIEGKSYVIDPTYNTLGHLTHLKYGGATVSYAPNALGQPTSVKTADISYAGNVKFYPSGQLKGFNYGNGIAFSQTLDDMQRPLDLLNTKDGQNKIAQSYRYDANNNVRDIFDLTNSSKDIQLTYDGVDRLETAKGSWGAGDFSYDTAGNLRTKNLGTQRLTYDYDPLTKRLSTVTGNYNFGYDNRGNVTSNGSRSFQFNRANQLTSSGSVSYIYDGHNRRVKKNGATASYSVYNKSGQLLLTDGPQGVTRYIYLGSQLIARIGNTAAVEDKPGYTGHLEDDDLSLTYMQQRYYDPVVGRFYSNDPVGFTGEPETFNRYSYANNNPYKYTDPDGRYPALARMMIAPPVAPTSSSLPNIPGHPGVPSGSGSSPTVPNIPINASSPIATIVVLIVKGVNESSDSGGDSSGSTNEGGIKNAEVGDTVRTPDNSKDFVKLKGGQGWKDSKTGDIAQKSKTNHSQDPKGEYKFGLKPNQPPTPNKKVTVTRSDSKVKKIDK